MEKQVTATKNNNLIDAGFFKRLNSMEMRIVNLAISRLNPIRAIDQNRRFEFTVKEFLDFNSGVTDQNNAYENVKNAVLNLGRVWIPVQAIEGFDITEVSLLTKRSYAKGKGKFMIEFNEEAMPHLVEIKNNYTSILLETFGKLKSEYSLKMYEILSRWAFKGVFKISVEKLKDLLGVSDLYDRFNNFSQRVLTPAIKEINAKSDISITIKSIRTGRSITDLEFSIFDKSKAIDLLKRPKFPHKNKYGKFVKLDTQNPKMSNPTYGNYARDCLKILEDFYTKIDDVTNDDLLHYWVFLSVNASHKSKLGTKKTFIETLQKRGYKIVECKLKKI